MWHSWRGHDDELSSERQNSQTYQDTILDPILQTNLNNSSAPLPPQSQLHILWPTFLKNAHPLINIFFDWEVEPIIRKLQSQDISLPTGEQALVSEISFIALSTLSREECQTLFSEEKTQLKIQYQRRLERVLLLSRYAETTSRHVLQALILYLVGAPGGDHFAVTLANSADATCYT
jgi:hypothetical protein